MDRIYLDHNATTPLRPEARAALIEALDRGVGNPSSVHGSGRAARAIVDEARERIAGALGVPWESVILTSGGTESNNLALLGATAAIPEATFLTSPLEHAAVGEPIAELERVGIPVERVGNDAAGRIDLDALARIAAAPRPLVVSLMAANSEIGSVNDIARVRETVVVARGNNSDSGAPLLLHCDAVQALGKIPLEPLLVAADLVSLSAHKVGGPVGVGVLLRKPRTPLVPITYGGSQEGSMRPGTENAAAVAAAAVAIELAVREREAFAVSTRTAVQAFWNALSHALPDAQLNGPGLNAPERLPNTVNISFPGRGDARMLVARFDLSGVEASAGSACASGSLEPSHVVSALGFGDDERERSAVRFSFGRDATVAHAKRSVERLRITLGEAP